MAEQGFFPKEPLRRHCEPGFIGGNLRGSTTRLLRFARNDECGWESIMEWPKVRLGEVLTERREVPDVTDVSLGKIRIVAKIGFNDGKIEFRANGETKTGMILVRPGDLLVSGINAAKGAIAIYGEDEPSPAAATIHYGSYKHNKERVEPTFLWWLLRSNIFREILLENVPGGIKTELKAKRLLPVPVPFPPLIEQRRIVARIEQLAAKIEEARGLRRQAVEEAEALFPTLMDEIFGKLAKIYPQKRIDELCEVVRGGSPRPAGSPVYYGGDIPFIKVGDITKDNGKYLYEASATVNNLGMKHSRFIKANTLMLTNSGATLGVPKITKIAACFNDGSQAFLNLSRDIDMEFLYYFFSSKTQWFRAHIARGQGQPNLNTEMTRQMTLSVPSLAEQRCIISYIDDLQAKVDNLRRLQTDTAADLDALLPSVLNKAFNGEL